jgi:hypothetical protein
MALRAHVLTREPEPARRLEHPRRRLREREQQEHLLEGAAREEHHHDGRVRERRRPRAAVP